MYGDMRRYRRNPYYRQAIYAGRFMTRNKFPVAAGIASAVNMYGKMPPFRGSNVHYGLSGTGLKGTAEPKNSKNYNKKSSRRRKQKEADKCAAMTTNELKKEVIGMKRSIKGLKCAENASLALMTYRTLDSFRQLSTVNSQVTEFYSANSISNIETSLAFLKYYDPANPASLITSDFSTGAFQRSICLKSISLKLLIKNNYQSDCKVRVYLCTVKDDTDQDPATAWSAAVFDGGNLVSRNTLSQYPTDYNLVNDLWNLKLVSNTSISPGESIKINHSVSEVDYNPATVDTHNLGYQKEYKSFGFLVTNQGTLGHDTVADEQGMLQSGLDIEQHRVYKISYDAGVNISYIHVVNTLDTFTNTGVESHQPIPDNVGYTVS